jgi:glutathione S-transferase
METPELYQFCFSHFNEKARWALDYKGIPHVRHSLLPGPHARTAKKISGQSAVPILKIGDSVVPGSAQIIGRLEEVYPDPPLYPGDVQQQRRALEIQDWFDRKVGPQIRCALFHALSQDVGYFSKIFSSRQSPVVRTAYRWFFPAVVHLIKRDMKINDISAARGREATQAALDFVERNSRDTGYLVGNSFSVADLAAASLLFIAVFPPELQTNLPEPRGHVIRQWIENWDGHPGTEWVREMFRRHRGTSAELTNRAA